jgi:4-hydroxybenzoate polyprenyltransferase
MRPKHYIKNLLIFIPLIFSLEFLIIDSVIKAIITFISFSLFASLVYVINDIADVEKDRLHHKKKFRPIASGDISVKSAIVFAVLLGSVNLLLGLIVLDLTTFIIIFSYFIINLMYSFKLKHVVLLDSAIIALGFILRVYAGATSINVGVSEWLLLTTMSGSLFMAFGKRYGEKSRLKGDTGRKVLKAYSKQSLEYFVVMSLTLTIIFYSLYTIIGNPPFNNMVYTVPLFILIVFRYFMLVLDNVDDGDPTTILLNDKVIQMTLVIFGILTGMLAFL